ncbi:phosphatidylserine decarboxylase proenzyme, mitochondrial [Dermatophagoides farinae]|uniref:phosphatidylserine decarboxylase proenzyme, mitochondrial n=1 Tax=Dermatophagoides farinae TaxID=6954 RepID=UPI003F5E0668
MMEIVKEKFMSTLPDRLLIDSNHHHHGDQDDEDDDDEIEHDHLLDFHHHQSSSSPTITKTATATTTAATTKMMMKQSKSSITTKKRKAKNALKFSAVSFMIIFYTYRWSKQRFDNNNSQKSGDNNHQQVSCNYSENFINIWQSFITRQSSDPIIIELTSYRICCALLIATVILLLILEKLFRIHIIIRTDDNDDNDHRGKLFINPGRLAASLSTQRIDHSKTVTISIIWLLLPWRSISRLWGYFNQIPLPVFIRRPLYIWYSRIFGCNLDEMANKNLYEYRNLSEFFRRQLMPSLRPIDRQALIVSPADGTVVQFEMVPIDGGFIGNVKGIHYSIENFLGPNNLNYSGFNRNWSLRPEKIQTNKRLYACVVYLAPGDYHRFHSPTDWIINRRRHFSGHLLSVRPSFVQRISNLFAINERVVYFGHWKFGFFAMAAVGATNVGSINVFVDPELQTNRFQMETTLYCKEKLFKKSIPQRKGEVFGEFNLGSTMVVIFEAPATCFNDINQHEIISLIQQKIHYGQPLLHIN